LTDLPTRCQKLSASEAPCPGRHHVGIPGEIISECPGDFVGIRSQGQEELMGFIKPWGPGQTWTVMELGTSIPALSLALAKTVPRKRGQVSQ
jgi:hypothetical protein